ncbi:DUF2330 domain-containing protein [Streptomyces sp. NPDC087212]|uniref:DUF2330 domain-containing protein n=1 Tax=Streptomyces sp. NPDC087212 TaxID=3365766 RepID=UPI0037F9B22D
MGARRKRHLRARAVAVALALLLVQVGSLVVPAYACGCGALIPGGDRVVTVGREESVVRWDGREEQIVMSLTVSGDAERAAWVLPVPHRATVRLGDRDLFTQLADLTAPVHRTRSHFWPQDDDWPLHTGDGYGQGPPPSRAAPGVGVVGRQRLGPFDVARLTATDPAALGSWLDTHGFALPPRLPEALQPYVDRHWEYVAVKLAPRGSSAATTPGGTPTPDTLATPRITPTPSASSPYATPTPSAPYAMPTPDSPYLTPTPGFTSVLDTTPVSDTGAAAAPALNGTLDPLHVSFASDSPVYPMRLSRLSRTPQSLGLYVLAPHRMETTSAIGGERPRTTFAGRVTARSGPLAELTAGGTPYLTAIRQEFPFPSTIDDDHVLRRAPADIPFQQVIYEDRLRTLVGVPAWLLTLTTGLFLTVAAATATPLYRRYRRTTDASISIPS